MNQNIKQLEAEQAADAKRLAVVKQLTPKEKLALDKLRKPAWKCDLGNGEWDHDWEEKHESSGEVDGGPGDHWTWRECKVCGEIEKPLDRLCKPSWKKAASRIGLALTVIIGASLIATSFAPTIVIDQYGRTVGYRSLPVGDVWFAFVWTTPTPKPAGTPRPHGPTFRY